MSTLSNLHDLYVSADLSDCLVEVVLCVLLGSFKFSMSDKEIVWNLAGAKYPTVGKASMKPSMPMRIELLKS